MLTDPRTAARHAAEQRRAADRVADDLELIDGLLAQAEALTAEVVAVTPYLNSARARAHLRPFADRLDDCLGDTLRAARKEADTAHDDTRPLARPGRAA